MRRVIAVLAATGLLLVACSSSSAAPPTPDPAIAFCPALDSVRGVAHRARQA